MNTEIDLPAQAGSNSLPDLAARIRAEHEAASDAVKRSLQHAIEAGRLLNEAKSLCGHGQWLPWLEEHCRIAGRTARLYMQLARRESEIGNVANLSVREAVAKLSEPEDEHEEPENEQEAIWQEGKRLADACRAADANLVNVFVDKCRELREFAEMMDHFAEEEAQALLKKCNKLPPKPTKWSRQQVKRWKRRTDDEARAQGWQLIAEFNSGSDDFEDAA